MKTSVWNEKKYGGCKKEPDGGFKNFTRSGSFFIL